jgi:CheY-like chemotaxis protein
MLSNYVSNALKFTGRGKVSIEGREAGGTQGAGTLQFSVSDTGIGIAPDRMERLFKPFSQGDSSTTREYGGTGLGLSIVSDLARLMGGEAGAESEVGRGSRFWFTVQACCVEEGDTAPAEAPEERPAESGATPDGYLLIVEDNVVNRRVLEAVLKRAGLRYDSVGNGREAVDLILAGAAPNLILMDCEMPVMNGYDATRAIRQWERENGVARIPIIAFTANAFHEDRNQCLAAGMDAFVSKPVSVRQLLAAVYRLLGPTAGTGTA